MHTFVILCKYSKNQPISWIDPLHANPYSESWTNLRYWGISSDVLKGFDRSKEIYHLKDLVAIKTFTWVSYI